MLTNLAYILVMGAFEDPTASVDDIKAAIVSAKSFLSHSEAERMVYRGLEHWESVLDQVLVATTEADRIRIIQTYFLRKSTEDPYVKSKYNIIQGVSKATVHVLLRTWFVGPNLSEQFARFVEEKCGYTSDMID